MRRPASESSRSSRPIVRGPASAICSGCSARRDPAVRSAAALGLTPHPETARLNDQDPASERIGPAAPVVETSAGLPAIPADRSDRDLVPDTHLPTARLARSLITALDGEGRGTIVLSAGARGYRRTAAFRCDIRRGILDAIGEVEEEHPTAGRMVEEWIQHSDGDHVLDAPELAVRLLEGCELLSGPEIPDHVRAWLEATIGPAALPPDTRDPLHGPKLEAIPDHEMTRCAERVLDACPDWLDRSPLTHELAEEIALREGCATPDPVRDAGAYRYLFEHLLIGRLELYARMLLWMGWLWHADGRPELVRSAFALACAALGRAIRRPLPPVHRHPHARAASWPPRPSGSGPTARTPTREIPTGRGSVRACCETGSP